MYKPFRIVIPNPSPVIPNAVRNLILLLRINSVRDLVLSERDCHVAPLLAMTTSIFAILLCPLRKKVSTTGIADG
jgi:hypothetical protein